MSYRPNAEKGLWLLFLLPTALWSSISESSKNEDFHQSRDKFLDPAIAFSLSIVFSLVSLSTAYHLVYAANRRKISDIATHLAKGVISDLFERSSSRDVRLRRTSKATSTSAANAANGSAVSNSSQEQQTEPVTFTKKDFHQIPGVRIFALFASFLHIFFCLSWFRAGTPGASWTVVISSAISINAFSHFLPRLFARYPDSFTFGEGCLVLQSCAVYVVVAFSSLWLEVHDTTTVRGSFSIISHTGTLSVLTIFLLSRVRLLRFLVRPTWFFVTSLATFFGVALPYLWWRLKRNPITWTISVLTKSYVDIALLASWLVMSALAVLVVIVINLRSNVNNNAREGSTGASSKASTRTRKIFHGLVVLVFTSGVLVNLDTLYLASAVAFDLFLYLELIRLYHIDPFGSYLHRAFQVFLDEKDQGFLILTHIYLLVGMSAPIWLTASSALTTSTGQISFKLLAGALSIGIGDSAASVVGSKLGRIKFPDSEKTVEGALASIGAQTLFVYLLTRLRLIKLHDGSSAWTQFLIPITVVAIVEALTSQIDNLVLPLLLYSLM